ncbi:hypothetical protein O181_037167 [Austropuccinia psidii MF-1]|uniref:Uncharacterized protein n=1 Tax=Austropuccinia psidii MF-1 TaxID=1389203 RepID=A0A9Q3D8G8_9BASI|nr:hypothetical protein [Austropuccinia psidii MF-1]
MIKNLEDMIQWFCDYGLDLKDSYKFTHDWCTAIPALELEYKKSIHSSIGKEHVVLEKVWNQRIAYETLKKDLADITPKAKIPKIMLYKSRHHENICMQYFLKYANKRWDKSQKPPNLKKGDLVLV